MKDQIFELLQKYINSASEVEKFHLLNVYRSIEFFYFKHILNETMTKEELEQYDLLTNQLAELSILFDEVCDDVSLPNNQQYYQNFVDNIKNQDEYEYQHNFVPNNQ